jgi:rod shape-determining protein MreD
LPAAEPTQGTQISYTGALLALLAGIAHAALAPVIEIGGVRPNLVLVVVVLVTVVRGFGTGIAWAFVAGLSANLLVREPLGGIPLALLLVVAAVSAGERVFGRLAWIYPIVAAFVGSLIADLVALGVLTLVEVPLGGALPFDLLLPAAVLNTAIAALLLYPARLLGARFEAPDQPAW